MVRGVLLACGIMLALALVPIVQFVGIPFGPFLGGYFGIASAGGQRHSRAARALRFGGLLGLLVFLVSVAVASILTVTSGLDLWLVWAAVVVFSLYSSSMGALGAMYALLRSAGASPAGDFDPNLAAPL